MYILMFKSIPMERGILFAASHNYLYIFSDKVLPSWRAVLSGLHSHLLGMRFALLKSILMTEWALTLLRILSLFFSKPGHTPGLK